MPPRLVVFDAYGTLFDLTTVVRRSASQLGASAAPMLALWRRKQLEYTSLRSLMQRYVPFEQVTREALEYALRTHGAHDASLVSELMESYLRVAPYDNVGATLRTLTSAGAECAILSNGTPRMLASALGASNLQALVPRVFSVDSVGCYKPDPRVYAMVTAQTAATPGDIVFVSANSWDASGAASFGFRTYWLNRNDAAAEPLPGAFAGVLTSLSALPDELA